MLCTCFNPLIDRLSPTVVLTLIWKTDCKMGFSENQVILHMLLLLSTTILSPLLDLLFWNFSHENVNKRVFKLCETIDSGFRGKPKKKSKMWESWLGTGTSC